MYENLFKGHKCNDWEVTVFNINSLKKNEDWQQKFRQR